MIAAKPILRQIITHSPKIGRGKKQSWQMLILFALLLLPLAAACQGDIGGRTDGWNPPASKDGVVYVGTKEGQVKAYDDDGFEGVKEVWAFPSGQTQPDIEGVYSTPLIVGDLVYVAAEDGFLYAIDKETGNIGTKGWKRPLGQPPELPPLVAGPAYDSVNQQVLSATDDGKLYAYNATSGDEAWTRPFLAGASIWSTPAVANGIGYFGSHDKKIYAVTLNDGKELWQYETGGVVAGKPLIFDGKLIAGSFDKKLYALSLADGTVEWTFGADRWFWAGAVTDGRTIFAPNMDGNIYALDRNGNLLWKHDVDASIVSQPVVTPRGLVVAAKDGRIILLDTSNEDLGLQRELSNLTLADTEIKAALFSDGESVYVGSQDHEVRRIEIKGGQVVMWCLHTEDTLCSN